MDSPDKMAIPASLSSFLQDKKKVYLTIGAVVVVAILALVLILLNSNSLNVFTPASQTATYRGVNYQLDYPNDWVVKSAEGDSLSLQVKDANGSMVVTTAKVGENPPHVNDFTNAVVEALTSDDILFELVDSQAIILLGEDATRFVYTATTGGKAVKASMVTAIKNGLVYTLEYVNTPESFDTNLAGFDSLVATFTDEVDVSVASSCSVGANYAGNGCNSGGCDPGYRHELRCQCSTDSSIGNDDDCWDNDHGRGIWVGTCIRDSSCSSGDGGGASGGDMSGGGGSTGGGASGGGDGGTIQDPFGNPTIGGGSGDGGSSSSTGGSTQTTPSGSRNTKSSGGGTCASSQSHPACRNTGIGVAGVCSCKKEGKDADGLQICSCRGNRDRKAGESCSAPSNCKTNRCEGKICKGGLGAACVSNRGCDGNLVCKGSSGNKQCTSLTDDDDNVITPQSGGDTFIPPYQNVKTGDLEEKGDNLTAAQSALEYTVNMAVAHIQSFVVQ